MNQKLYQALSRVLVRVGANLQPGETVVIKAPPSQYPLVRELTRVCYQNGANYVWADYEDEAAGVIRAQESLEGYLDHTPHWLHDCRKGYAEDHLCLIELRCPYTGGGTADPVRFGRVQRSERECLAGFNSVFGEGNISYVKTVIPCPEWAAVVYPDLEPGAAYQRLWGEYARICRLDREDPVRAWEEHRETICQKKAVLDSLDIRALHFRGEGTDLEVGLVEGGHWLGGYAVNQKSGLKFVPNIPTEEIFFVPHKYHVNGTVCSTMPLNNKGNLIEDIVLTVRDGKVQQYTASKNRDLLGQIIEADEGSCYFGEISLVSIQSPIFRTGTVFYETLLDENAACHMAFGNATPSILENGFQLTREERDRLGINFSGLHVDFMIGSPGMNVEAHTGDGRIVPVMRNGDWAL